MENMLYGTTQAKVQIWLVTGVDVCWGEGRTSGAATSCVRLHDEPFRPGVTDRELPSRGVAHSDETR